MDTISARHKNREALHARGKKRLLNAFFNVFTALTRLTKLNKRLFFPLIIGALLFTSSTREVTVSTLSDAYFQVAAFVYASLALYYLATLRIPAASIRQYMQNHPLREMGIAALLGALPGCGGAIIVVTQFTHGAVSFGAVVAVLTSTMGDAAFLLLAQAPLDAITVMCISVVVGMITGIVVNRFHHYASPTTADSQENKQPQHDPTSDTRKTIVVISQRFWLVLSVPSLIVATALAFQLSVHDYLTLSETQFHIIGAILCVASIVLWSLSNSGSGYASLTKEDEGLSPPNWKTKAALDTQFVLAWVVFAFLIFELAVLWFGLDIAAMVHSMGGSVVALAIIIGFLPGCGPQILVTTLYLNGVVPFSAQLANAISNDGDALFPAIALSPKAALIATLYSAIPACVVGYGYWFLFE